MSDQEKEATMPSPRDLDRDFASKTTLHGVGYVIESPRIYIKLTWLCILLVCLGICVWQITDRIQNYMKYEANTAVSVECMGDLHFPAVTICNFNRYRKSKLTEADLLALSDVTKLDVDPGHEDDIAELKEAISRVGSNFSYTEFIRRTGFELDTKTLLRCEWQKKQKSCTAENFTHVFTTYGNCWTFNSGENGSVPILKQTHAGSGNGLRMMINIQQNEYAEHETSDGHLNAGLKILVHDQSTPAPSIESEGMAIAPGVHAFVGVRKVEFNNLDKPWGKCNASASVKHYKKYTLEACDLECQARAVSEHCQCKIFRHPGHKPECSPHQIWTCAQPVLEKLVRSRKAKGCGCTVPCNYSEFRSMISLATLPNNNYRPNMRDAYGEDFFTNYTLQEAKNIIRENWILLDVYYETLNYEKFRQIQAVTISALISDIGGQLGLFLGASIITLAEIADYIRRRINLMLANSAKRRTVVKARTAVQRDDSTKMGNNSA